MSDITDLNALGLVVPTDGTRVLVEGGRWRMPPNGAAKADRDRMKPMHFQGVGTPDGKLVDVVAWEASFPNIWWLQTGNFAILGAQELERVSWVSLPFYLVESPAAWQRARAKGFESVCILDWTECDTPSLFGVCWGPIYVESPELGSRLASRQYDLRGPQLNILVERLA